MSDEIHHDHSNENSSIEHIEQTKERRFSSEDHQNDSNIQLVQNGDHSEEQQTVFSEAMPTDDQSPTTPSHIELVNTSDKQVPSDQDSIHSSEDQYKLLQNENTPSLPTDMSLVDISTSMEQTQRELDEEEIPLVQVPVDTTPIENNEAHATSTDSERNPMDDRPLTALETPYETNHHTEVDTQLTDEHDQTSSNDSSIENDSPLVEVQSNYHEERTNPSLPDVVAETLDENSEDLTPELNDEDESFVEEVPVQVTPEFNEENFPPLPSATIPLTQVFEHGSTNGSVEVKPTFNEVNFPPLPPPIVSLEQVLEHGLAKPELAPLEPEDIFKDKSLIKQTIVQGIPNTQPTRSTMVKVSYTLSLVDQLTTNARVIEEATNEVFFVSEHDTIPAIDICVQRMNRGEHALIDSDIRYGYGETGCEEKHIPSLTTLNPYRMKIDLQLHDWQTPSDIEKIPVEERISWADKKRQMGNFYYRRKDYQTSRECYKGALRFLDTDINPSFDQNARTLLHDRYLQVLNNAAQVNLLLEDYPSCLNATQNVLKSDPKNIKALFRQGKALFKLGQYEQAIRPLKLFIQIQREQSSANLDTNDANQMISLSENKLATYQKDEKEIYRRMFQSPPATTTSLINEQNPRKTNDTNSNWWPYVALGSALLATVGFVTFLKYRKVS